MNNLTKKLDPLTAFETVGDLYYADTLRLRPGKSDPIHDSNSDENRAVFEEWLATRFFTCAIARIAVLEAEREKLSRKIEDLEEAT